MNPRSSPGRCGGKGLPTSISRMTPRIWRAPILWRRRSSSATKLSSGFIGRSCIEACGCQLWLEHEPYDRAIWRQGPRLVGHSLGDDWAHEAKSMIRIRRRTSGRVHQEEASSCNCRRKVLARLSRGNSLRNSAMSSRANSLWPRLTDNCERRANSDFRRSTAGVPVS